MVRPSSVSIGTSSCPFPAGLGARAFAGRMVTAPAAAASTKSASCRPGWFTPQTTSPLGTSVRQSYGSPGTRSSYVCQRGRGRAPDAGRRSARPSRVISTTPQGKSPSPRTRSRNRASRSTTSILNPARARAAPRADPATPPPTTTTSKTDEVMQQLQPLRVEAQSGCVAARSDIQRERVLKPVLGTKRSAGALRRLGLCSA